MTKIIETKKLDCGCDTYIEEVVFKGKLMNTFGYSFLCDKHRIDEPIHD